MEKHKAKAKRVSNFPSLKRRGGRGSYFTAFYLIFFLLKFSLWPSVSSVSSVFVFLRSVRLSLLPLFGCSTSATVALLLFGLAFHNRSIKTAPITEKPIMLGPHTPHPKF